MMRILGIGLCCWLAGCASLRPTRSALAERVGATELTRDEIRIRVRAKASTLSAQMEQLLDEVAEIAPSPQLRLQMTRAKTQAIPALQLALFQPDPVAALVDTWALLAQIQGRLEALGSTIGGGGQRGAHVAPGIEAMEAELIELWQLLVGREEVGRARESVWRWARAHPLEGPILTRTSTAGLLAALTAEAPQGLMASAGSLVEDTRDLTARLDLQAAFLPRQAHWQAETLILEALLEPDFVWGALPALGELDASVDRLFRAAEVLPDLVARERNALQRAVREERLGFQDFMKAERRAVLEALRSERVATLAEFDAQRMRLLAELEVLEQRAVVDAFARATKLFDRVLLWLTVLLAATGLATLLTTLWIAHRLGRVLERRGPPAG